jgi:hypothetical protein
MTNWESQISASAQHLREMIVSRRVNLGKGENSKFEVWFLLNIYHFCKTIKSKMIIQAIIVVVHLYNLNEKST